MRLTVHGWQGTMGIGDVIPLATTPHSFLYYIHVALPVENGKYKYGSQFISACIAVTNRAGN